MRLTRLLAALCLMLLPVVAATPATAAQNGYVRLAHLSPDTPEVDVYFSSFSGRTKVFPGVSYATVSPYQGVGAGRYAVAMRAPGSPADSEPLLSTTLQVEGGKSYTVAGVGPRASVELKVLDDDLSRPTTGTARMRVVQASASADTVDVATTTGIAIADDIIFPSTTGYTEVPAQVWTLQATSAQGERAVRTVDVRAGAIYTVLVLDRQEGSGLRLSVLADAAGAGQVPTGAVRAGGAGASPWLGAAVLLGLAALLLALWSPGRSPARG